MTKFIIREGNKLFLKERTHIDNMFLGSSFRETDLRTELKPDSIKKIFENPITAIAYDTTHYQHNIEMDKKSLTKALDFWINDKVLQNEKILFIEGKLDDVHEIELKNLIELREFVQKQDNDTVFTRFRESVSGKEYDFTKKSSWGVEFFVKRELVPNNIKYNYTSLFIGDGARWDFGGLNSDDISFQLFVARHNTDPGTAITNSFSTAANHVSEALNDLSRALSRSNGAGTDVTQGDPNPYNWRVSRMGNGVTFGLFDQTDALIRVNDTFMNNFPSASAAEESRRQHRIVWDSRHHIRNEGGFSLPAGTVTEIVGEAEGPLAPGDLITMNPNTRRWRKAVMGSDIGPFLVNVRPVAFGEMVEAVRRGSFTTNTNGPDHLLHSNLHPGITSPPPSNRIQDITFENLTIHPLSETFEAGENSYTMTTYAAENGQYEMTFDLYVTGREIDRISEGFRTHTLRIEDRERGRMEIDGELYYYVNYTIIERIRNSGSDFVPRTFLDMYIDRTSMERSPPMYALGSDINRGPIQYKIHLTSQDHKTEIELTIRDRNNTISDVLQHIRSEPVNVGILDREVTLNGYSFPTIDFPEVTWSSGS